MSGRHLPEGSGLGWFVGLLCALILLALAYLVFVAIDERRPETVITVQP